MELGYPAYFVTMLGVWKVLGGSVILLPGMGARKGVGRMRGWRLI